ncbi:cysteine desulfurase NifS, partial [Pedobacter paludis]
ISVMYGNNEVGTVQPIRQIGELARERGIAFHVDAVQAFGMLPIDLSELPVDLMSFSAHKLYGPKGVGALYVNKRIAIQPLLYGGSQERKRRAGTENVAGIAGFAKAAELAVA